MIPYADFTYFGVLLYVAVPTLILGLLGRLSWRWVLAMTLIMLALQYNGTVRVGRHATLREIWILIGYALVQVAIVRGFLAARLWHGTAWYFLLYGLYHASLLVGHDVFSRWNQRRRFWGEGPWWQAAGVFVTFNLVCFGFLLFSGRLDGKLLEPRRKGTIETADCRMIAGWAVDDNRPDDPLDIEFYDGDAWLGTTRADQLRKELAESWGTKGRHGCTYTLPAALRDGTFHSIHAKVSGTNILLYESPRSIACGNPRVTVEGIHERTHCGAVSGWAWDSGQPDARIDVDIYDGDRLLARVSADAYRPGLDGWKGKGYHGFDYALPATVKDGRPHLLRVMVSGTQIPLQRPPQSITCTADVDPLQGFEGFLDGADCTTAIGWARDTSDPHRPVDVNLYDGETLLATVRADRLRPDLLKAGLGGQHGCTYSVSPGLGDRRPHVMTARISGTQIALRGSPKPAACGATGPESPHLAGNATVGRGAAEPTNRPGGG